MAEVRPTSCPEKSHLPEQWGQSARPSGLERQAGWLLGLPACGGSQRASGTAPLRQQWAALPGSEKGGGGLLPLQHGECRAEGGPVQAWDIFASWTRLLIGPHFLSGPVSTLHSFKANMKMSARKRKILVTSRQTGVGAVSGSERLGALQCPFTHFILLVCERTCLPLSPSLRLLGVVGPLSRSWGGGST